MRMTSRISRIEERRTKKRLVFISLGIIAVFVLVVTVGIPLIVGTSVLLGNLNGNSPLSTSGDTTPPFPPVLSSVPSATNSANLKLEGYGEAQTTLFVILNGEEVKKALLPLDGTFSFNDLKLDTGENTLRAYLTDAAGNESELSDEITVTFKKTGPKLEITEPEDGKTYDKNYQEITIKGKVDPGSQVFINDRFVSVKDDGSFEHRLRLSEGENILSIIGRDTAGNETKIERKVTFQT